ncbi:MAG: hypothetical protein IPJ12_06000 [Betaproteobacteria bacterium]|nr:hypothetical protein [Betaproteobacteria bacterium]
MSSHVSFVASAKLDSHYCPSAPKKYKPLQHKNIKALICMNIQQIKKQAHILILGTLETGDALCLQFCLHSIDGGVLDNRQSTWRHTPFSSPRRLAPCNHG